MDMPTIVVLCIIAVFQLLILFLLWEIYVAIIAILKEKVDRNKRRYTSEY